MKFRSFKLQTKRTMVYFNWPKFQVFLHFSPKNINISETKNSIQGIKSNKWSTKLNERYGNIFPDYLTDPSNKNGLWGTTEKCVRSSLTGTSAMFIPSTKIYPVHIGVRRKRAFKTLDFPAPVLPMIPTWKKIKGKMLTTW